MHEPDRCRTVKNSSFLSHGPWARLFGERPLSVLFHGDDVFRPKQSAAGRERLEIANLEAGVLEGRLCSGQFMFATEGGYAFRYFRLQDCIAESFQHEHFTKKPPSALNDAL